MSPEPRVAWIDGRIVPFARACVPLEDRGLQFGESLYEVVAVTAGRPRHLGQHGRRMTRAAELIGIAGGVPDEATWERIAAALLEADPLGEGLLIAQVTGGAAPRSHVPAKPPVPRFFAYLRRFRFPREADVDRGLAVITAPDDRWGRCDLKTTMLLPAVLGKRRAAESGAGEVIFVGPDGLVREGGASNVLVVEGRTLCSPKQTQHVLPGLTRPLIEDLAGRAGLTVTEGEVDVERLCGADEVMVVSTTLLVMPVVRVDGRDVGGGRPGPVTRDLAVRLRHDLEL